MTDLWPDEEPIDQLIERVRTGQGKSQYTLAEDLAEASKNPSVTREYVARWENRKRIPTPYWRHHLHTTLGIPRGVLDKAAQVAKSRRSAAAESVGGDPHPGFDERRHLVNPTTAAEIDVPLLVPHAVHTPGATPGPGYKETERRALFHGVLAPAGQPRGYLLAEVERLRQQMDRTLASGTVTENQMDQLDETILRLRREYLTTPPLPMLCQLMLEFADVQHLASQRQPGSIQRRLSHVTATLAVLSADALMKLGDIRQARAYYNTAKTAADDTGDPRLRALVRAQEAMLPYYYGDLAETVELARQAQALARAVPCSPTALAAAAEGRALARSGDHQGASAALAEAQRLYSKIDDRDTGGLAFDFSEQRLNLYLSGAHAHLPDLKQAQATQERALALCPEGSTSIDPALIKLDQATSLAHAGHEDDACELAQQTLLTLPPEHRTSIVFVRAGDVRRAIPAQRRSGKRFRDLDEILALEKSSATRARFNGGRDA